MEQDKYLNTCPFCTSEARIGIDLIPPPNNGVDEEDIPMYYAKCINALCQASQCHQKTPQEVVINWNKRR